MTVFTTVYNENPDNTSHDLQAGLGPFLVVYACANCRDLMPFYRLIYL